MLTEVTVTEIRHLLQEGRSQRNIAEQLGISRSSVQKIARRYSFPAEILCGSCLSLRPFHYRRYQQLRACIRVAEELELREKETASHEPDCVSPVTADASIP